MSSLTPHGPGFAFVDSFVLGEDGKSLVATKWLDPALAVFADHFPGDPLFPGVLLVEAAAQAAGILWQHAVGGKSGRVMLAQVQQFKLQRPVLPGQTLEMRVELEKDFGSLAQFIVGVRVAGEDAASGRITLARQL